MEKFTIGLAIGCICGALLTANNYKMRTLVRKSQQEIQTKLDDMLDEKLRAMNENADNEEDDEDTEESKPVKKRKTKS